MHISGFTKNQHDQMIYIRQSNDNHILYIGEDLFFFIDRSESSECDDFCILVETLSSRLVILNRQATNPAEDEFH